jgi:hypothetical protein
VSRRRCKTEGCDELHYARGYGISCYRYLLRNGTPPPPKAVHATKVTPWRYV